MRLVTGWINFGLEGMTMKRLTTVTIVVLACAIAASSQQKSLYERLGGQPAIEAVVKDFGGRVLADKRVNKKFARSDANRLIKNLIDFVCVATGGPCTYTGKSMKEAHKHMAVTTGEFNALADDLVATLNKFKVPDKERNDLMAAIGPLAKDIVEKKKSNATGTELPKSFKPAPPLKNN